jgi:catechol 2,3-dioxygenase-like lactoylglutathione lyase family enzyme
VRLDHVVICVSDFERSNAFYRDVIGAEVVDVDGRIAYRILGQQLNVHGPGVRPALIARVPVAPGNSDLCFEWDGPIEGAIAHLVERGVTIEAGPMTRGGAKGSGISVYFRDPDGSLLEFISYGERELSPRRRVRSVARTARARGLVRPRGRDRVAVRGRARGFAEPPR